MKNAKKHWIVFSLLFTFSLCCYAFLTTRKAEGEGFSQGLHIEKAEQLAEADGTKTKHNFLFHVELLKKLAEGARKFLPASQF